MTVCAEAAGAAANRNRNAKSASRTKRRRETYGAMRAAWRVAVLLRLVRASRLKSQPSLLVKSFVSLRRRLFVPLRARGVAVRGRAVWLRLNVIARRAE